MDRYFEEIAKKIDDIYIVGIDQLLVDIEIEVDDAFLEKYKWTLMPTITLIYFAKNHLYYQNN